jgi:hypothetical protein
MRLPWWGWLVLVILGVMVFRNPTGAGHDVGEAWHAFWTFVGSI